ncbi:MAG: hypothetical protein J5I98_23565 [Phaeodactylibacter sp.]|nr:hypothetical protein [Phaeodactylibacter sp.]
MPDNVFDNNRCIEDDLKKIRREIKMKSRRFDLPIEDELESLLDDYSRKVSSSDKFHSDETDSFNSNTLIMKVKIKNAIELALKEVDDRLAHFAQAGENLRQDTKFRALQSQLKSLMKAYAEKHENNTIIVRRSDEEEILKWKGYIKHSPDTKNFTKVYELLIGSINTILSRKEAR